MIEQKQRKKIGEILYEARLVTKKQIQLGLEEQKRTGKRIGEILVDEGNVTEEEVLGALEIQLGVTYIDLNRYSIDYRIATIIPESIARHYTVIAVEMDGDKLKVAMKDPENMFALDDLKLVTRLEIIPLIASESSILKLINQTYISAQTSNIVNQVEKQVREEYKQTIEETASHQDDPIIQLVDNLIKRCILQGASDLHIEPFKEYVRIRMRVDGQLQEMMHSPKETLNKLTTRIKLLAGLNIAEHRLPQDGRMSKMTGDQQVDLRISILPTIYGEKTVIRFIYQNGMKLELEDMGFYPSDYEKVICMLNNPNGILLLTGPTGSGKSTTLSAALRLLNKENINIVTVENPIENVIEGINQVETNSKIGLTFAVALRSILRQDPDILMIGEIRDSETSSIAIRAAITGHLVLSTLHTNDAASSILRLIDMGAEAYMVGTAVKGVISQRLVRRLCNHCKTKHVVTASESCLYKIPEGTVIYEEKGCSSCANTGYQGRMAIHEVLYIDSDLQDMISSGHSTTKKIKEEALKKGMRTLWDNALYNVLQGNTSMKEILKVAYEE